MPNHTCAASIHVWCLVVTSHDGSGGSSWPSNDMHWFCSFWHCFIPSAWDNGAFSDLRRTLALCTDKRVITWWLHIMEQLYNHIFLYFFFRKGMNHFYTYFMVNITTGSCRSRMTLSTKPRVQILFNFTLWYRQRTTYLGNNKKQKKQVDVTGYGIFTIGRYGPL